MSDVTSGGGFIGRMKNFGQELLKPKDKTPTADAVVMKKLDTVMKEAAGPSAPAGGYRPASLSVICSIAAFPAVCKAIFRALQGKDAQPKTSNMAKQAPITRMPNTPSTVLDLDEFKPQISNMNLQQLHFVLSEPHEGDDREFKKAYAEKIKESLGKVNLNDKHELKSIIDHLKLARDLKVLDVGNLEVDMINAEFKALIQAKFVKMSPERVSSLNMDQLHVLLSSPIYMGGYLVGGKSAPISIQVKEIYLNNALEYITTLTKLKGAKPDDVTITKAIEDTKTLARQLFKEEIEAATGRRKEFMDMFTDAKQTLTEISKDLDDPKLAYLKGGLTEAYNDKRKKVDQRESLVDVINNQITELKRNSNEFERFVNPPSFTERAPPPSPLPTPIPGTIATAPPDAPPNRPVPPVPGVRPLPAVPAGVAPAPLPVPPLGPPQDLPPILEVVELDALLAKFEEGPASPGVEAAPPPPPPEKEKEVLTAAPRERPVVVGTPLPQPAAMAETEEAAKATKEVADLFEGLDRMLRGIDEMEI